MRVQRPPDRRSRCPPSHSSDLRWTTVADGGPRLRIAVPRRERELMQRVVSGARQRPRTPAKAVEAKAHIRRATRAATAPRRARDRGAPAEAPTAQTIARARLAQRAAARRSRCRSRSAFRRWRVAAPRASPAMRRRAGREPRHPGSPRHRHRACAEVCQLGGACGPLSQPAVASATAPTRPAAMKVRRERFTVGWRNARQAPAALRHSTI